MNIIVFSNNAKKIEEIKSIFSNYQVELFSKYIKPFDVIENGDSFASNAKLKVLALKNALPKELLKDSILLAEDSGICIECLKNKPGIYSSRFANIDFNDMSNLENIKDASDMDNISRVFSELKALNLSQSPASFISCVSCYKDDMFFSTHGFLNGKVINEMRGKCGFGYDPIFIPNGYTETLGELDSTIKNKISHRFKSLELMQILLK